MLEIVLSIFKLNESSSEILLKLEQTSLQLCFAKFAWAWIKGFKIFFEYLPIFLKNLAFIEHNFLHKKLLIYRNRRHRTTIYVLYWAYQVLVWTTFLFYDISLWNLERIIVYCNSTNSEVIVQIGLLEHKATI